MAIETERRFLVKNDGWRQYIVSETSILQGYLSDDPERIVRIRIHGTSYAFLTIKGPKNDGSGLEFEYPIPVADGYRLILMCKSVLDKTRYCVAVDNVEPTWHSGVIRSTERWEIDVFHGANEGLVIAELEFKTDDTTIHTLPNWLGDEITDDVRYANSNLAQYPYTTWDKLWVNP